MRFPRACSYVLAGLVAASPFWFASAQTEKGRTFAFLVACGKYDKTQLDPVEFTAAEKKVFRDVLAQSGIAPQNVVFLHDRTNEPERYLPTRANILTELDLLVKRLRPEDSLIVALSGHGLQFKGDKYGYFCPLDAKVARKESLLPMEGDDGLLTRIDRSKAGRKCLIINACRNPPRSPSLAGEKLAFLNEYNEDAPRGTVMLLACGKGECSWFYDEKEEKSPERRGRSLFMYHLTEAWKGNYAQGKKITLDHVVYEVKERVEADAVTDFRQNQIPILKRKFAGSWELASAATVSGYDLTGGHRFVHFGVDGSVHAVVCGIARPDNGANHYEAWVVDLKTGQKIAGPLSHQKVVSHPSFSVDGTRVVTTSFDDTAVVWDARTGQKIAGPLNHQGWLYRAAFSADGTRVVTTGDRAMVWDARTGQKIAGPLMHRGFVAQAAFSVDGTRVVTASHDKTAVIWDAHTGQKIAGPLIHQGEVYHAAFSADGRHVVTGGDIGAVVWDARTGKRVAGLLGPHGFQHAAFSADGTRVVTAGFDGTAAVWDTRTGKKIAGPLIHQSLIHHAAFSADGTRVVTASYDKTAVVWDAHTGQKIVGLLSDHGSVFYAAFSTDGTRVATVGYETATLWDARSGNKLGEASLK